MYIKGLVVINLGEEKDIEENMNKSGNKLNYQKALEHQKKENEKSEKKENKKGKKKKIKGEKNLLVTLFKLIFFIVVVGIQVGFMILLYVTTQEIYRYATFLFEIIKIIAVIYLLYRHDDASYKISWILLIMFFPIVGVIIYYLWGNSRLKSKSKKQIMDIEDETSHLLKRSKSLENKIGDIDSHIYNQVSYMTNVTGYPIHENLSTEYFSTGEDFFKSLNEDLKKAKKYILMEFYILSAGKLWNEVLNILATKAREGIKVEIIIDSLGSLPNKPKNLVEDLEEMGITVHLFNPLTPIVNGYINYRDHRKIVVIDGICSYTGGINLADEYANIIEKYGYWKDVGMKITGKASWSFTLMFLRTLQTFRKSKIDYEWYKPDYENAQIYGKNGYILPFADGPYNKKNPVENIYIQTINYAKKYVYITTPYFVISNSMLNSILNSARSGVDVRIILPHIPDKKVIQMVTRSYYEVLLEAGVKVYEFKPGFIHSKTFVVDDNISIVGTANLDFRSANLNFECAAWTYMTNKEIVVKKDFIKTLEQCIEINLEEWKKRPKIKKATEALLSAFSPML